MGRDPGAQRLQPQHHLPLVVHRAAGDDARAERMVHEARLEGRAGPEVQRLRGLHVVVAVVEQVRGAPARPLGRSWMVREHDRVARRLAGFSLEAHARELAAQPFGGPAAIPGVRGLRAHARDAEPLEPAGHRAVGIRGEVIEDEMERVLHGGILKSPLITPASGGACNVGGRERAA